MTDAVALEQQTTEQLRDRALSVATHRGDLKFLWSVLTHLDSVEAASTEGGSAGEISGTIADLVVAVQQLTGHAELGEAEPLLRAKFLDYLRDHG